MSSTSICDKCSYELGQLFYNENYDAHTQCKFRKCCLKNGENIIDVPFNAKMMLGLTENTVFIESGGVEALCGRVLQGDGSEKSTTLHSCNFSIPRINMENVKQWLTQQSLEFSIFIPHPNSRYSHTGYITLINPKSVFNFLDLLYCEPLLPNCTITSLYKRYLNLLMEDKTKKTYVKKEKEKQTIF
jgi:hypothetical protein